MRGGVAPSRALSDSALLVKIITKQPSLMELIELDENTPDSVMMTQPWMALHDALPPSEFDLRHQLMLRVRPAAPIEADSMRPELTSATGKRTTRTKSLGDSAEPELEAIFIADACLSPQYDCKLSELRAATSLAAQRPETALDDLRDGHTMSELRAALEEAAPHAAAFEERSTEPEVALARCVIEEHFKVEEQQLLLAAPKAQRAPQSATSSTWWRRSR